MRIGTTDRENVSRRQMTNTIKDRKKRLRKALKKQVQEDQKILNAEAVKTFAMAEGACKSS
jgi:hypothetical protein